MARRMDGHVVVRRDAFELDVELRAEPGEVLAVLGPNGSGKTTLLRALAGLERLSAGRLAIGDRTLDGPDAPDRPFVVPARRRVGFVPQDLALFPHLSSLENVSFGPRSAGIDRRTARATAREWLDRLGLADLAGRRPGALSGGQAQRVALARALATGPDLLLLDEPLSALDARTRAETRQDLRRHLAAFTGTTLVVTHDPVDALVLAGQVLVLDDGRATQAGPLADVVARPRTAYVAELVGTNLLAGTVDRADPTVVHVGDARVVAAEPAGGSGDAVFVRIPPAAVAVHDVEPGGSPRNRWPAEVADLDQLGSRVRVHLTGALALVAEVTPGAAAELGLVPGKAVWTSLKATEVVTYPR